MRDGDDRAILELAADETGVVQNATLRAMARTSWEEPTMKAVASLILAGQIRPADFLHALGVIRRLAPEDQIEALDFMKSRLDNQPELLRMLREHVQTLDVQTQEEFEHAAP